MRGRRPRWPAVGSLVSDAIEDQRGSGGSARAAAAEHKLAAAGIGPDHPSLYPGGAPERT